MAGLSRSSLEYGSRGLSCSRAEVAYSTPRQHPGGRVGPAGRLQSTFERRSEIEPLHRQRLLEDRAGWKAAAAGWSRSGDCGNRSHTRSARSAESRSEASREALLTEVVQPFREMADHVAEPVRLTALHHTAKPKRALMARRSPGAPSMTNTNIRSVGRRGVTKSVSRPLATVAVSGAPFVQSQQALRRCNRSREPAACGGPGRILPSMERGPQGELAQRAGNPEPGTDVDLSSAILTSW